MGVHIMNRQYSMGIRIALTVALLLVGSLAAQAGAVNNILAKLPAQSSAEADQLMGQLLALGPDAIAGIGERLVPMGQGNDTAARFALSGLAKYVSKGTDESQRLMLAKTWCRLLQDPTLKPEVKAFLMQRLELFGKNEIVPVVAGFLHDETLCDPAAQDLVAVGTPEAARALLKALPGADDEKARITIIKALGDLQCKKVARQARKSVASDNAKLREVSRYALAQSATRSAAKPLEKAAKSASGYEHIRAGQQALLYARNAGTGKWKRNSSMAICRTILKSWKDAPGCRIAAIDALVRIGGMRAFPDILDAMYDPEETVRAAAVAAAVKLDADATWEKLLADSATMQSPHRAEALLALSEWPDDQMTPLFNGHNLDGWVGDVKGYAAENGLLVCKPGGNLYTDKDYGDFVFRFEFKLPPGGNNGLAVRCPANGGYAFNGMEIQILDNYAEKYKNLHPYQYHGSIYGIVPAKRGFELPPEHWNREEVIARGRNITVILNGHIIVDANLDEATKNGPMDHREHKNLDLKAARLGFLGHGDVVQFRNIRVKTIP